MKLYDEIIKEVLHLAEGARSLPVTGDPGWAETGNKSMILRSEMAYELGGADGRLPAYGGTILTDEEAFVPEDEILLLGRDLGEIREDSPYARIAVARVKPESMGEGNALYNAIRRIEYVRYHVNPEGFMVRISTVHERESARVAKSAVEAGIGFSEIGNLMLKAFHRNPDIEAVKILFITDPAFDYKELEAALRKTEKITRTIDHMLQNLAMDCKACSLQEICDEVEGMRELHFGLQK